MYIYIYSCLVIYNYLVIHTRNKYGANYAQNNISHVQKNPGLLIIFHPNPHLYEWTGN